MPHSAAVTQHHDAFVGVPCRPGDMVAVPGTAHALQAVYVLDVLA